MVRRFWDWFWSPEPPHRPEIVPDNFEDPKEWFADVSRRLYRIERVNHSTGFGIALIGLVLVVIAIGVWTGNGLHISIGGPVEAPAQSEAPSR